MTERKPIQFEPGVYRMGSEAEMAGRWYETHLIRWTGGVMRPIAGWERMVLDGTFASPVRQTHVWMTRDGIRWIAVLCEEHLYAVTMGGDVTDITPVGGITGPGDPVEGGYGDAIYYGAGGGLDPPGAPPFTTTAPDPPDTFTELPPLYTDPNGYGMPRPDKDPMSNVVLGPMWSLDNFGDTLLAMASTDRRLLEWDPNSPGTPAAPVVATETTGGTTPTGRFFVVTPERHVMVFEADDIINRFAWCSQEDVHDWAYTSTENSAGFYELQPAQPFVTAVATRYGVLAFTISSAYLVGYVSVPYIYSYNFIGNHNAPVTGNAIAVLANRTVWHASDGFWTFDGQNVAPLQCPVLDFVQRTIDPAWAHRRPVAIPIGVESEVWFFFPARGETENTTYVAWNFDEKWWSMGKLRRTAGSAGSALSFPILSDGTDLYLHEKGLFYADAPELPYAQTAAINVGNGGRYCTVRQGLVDTRAPAEDVQFWIGGRKGRIADATNIQDAQLSLAVRRDRGRLDFRVTGRDIIIRIQSMRNGSEPWTFGQMLVKVIQRGQR